MGNLEQERFSCYRTASIINLIVLVLQGTILYIAFNLSLLSDTVHTFSDEIVLIGTCFAAYQATFQLAINTTFMQERMTRISIILLWLSAPFIIWESWERIHSPVQFPGWPVVGIALVSMIGSVWIHRIIDGIGEENHNHLDHANLLHVLGDIIFAGAVLLSASIVLVFKTGAYDGHIGMIVTLLFSWRGWMLWRDLTAHQKKRLSANKVPHEHSHDCGHHH